MRLFFSLVLFFTSLCAFTKESSVLDEQKIESKEAIQATTAKTASNEAGKEIYERFCVVCHRDGLIGAPKAGDEGDWKPRMDKKTMDELLASVLNGLNAMPSRGTCSECSDEDLKHAIEYMLPHYEKSNK